MEKKYTYADAGVDRKLEENSTKAIINLIRTNMKSSQEIPKGLFAGAIPFGNHLLSLATDGVGTKVLLADELDIHDTVGIDCVAMNVNDLITIGAIPSAFVDYIAIRKPDEKKITDIVKGLIEGCNQAEIPLIGGETAILPELICGPSNHFDLAGTALGIHETTSTITGKGIKVNDIIIGIQSSGIHSNGLTLARKFFTEDDFYMKKQLLKPTRIYVKCIKKLLQEDLTINGMAHITGGGVTNLLRLGKFHYKLDKWDVPEIFNEIKKRGNIEDKEMFTTFNQGMGFMVIINPQFEQKVLQVLNEFYPAQKIGAILKGNSVTVNGLLIN